MQTIHGNFVMWLVNKIEHWAVFESFGLEMVNLQNLDVNTTNYKHQKKKKTTQFFVPF